MDNREFYRKKFLDELMKLKEKYDLPDAETDKVILDFDNVGQFIDDPDALTTYYNQLLTNVEYRANAGVSPNPFEGEDLNLSTPNDNYLLYVDERRAELIERINNIENDVIKKGLLKRYEDYDSFIFDDMTYSTKLELLHYTNEKVVSDMENFKDILNTPYRELVWPDTENIESTFFDYVEPNPIEDAYWAEAEGWQKDAEGNPIDPSKKPESFSNFQKDLNIQFNNIEGINNEPGQPLSPEEKQFNEIIKNEQSIHWWRYDDSWSDEAKDYMERYVTFQLTDEEMQQLIDDQKMQQDVQNKINDAKEKWNNQINDSAAALNISDTNAWRKLVGVGMRVLGAIDEDIVYSPLKLAQIGLNKLGLTTAAKAVGGFYGAATGYEQYLFYGMAGLAALTQAGPAIKGVVRDSIKLPSQMAQGILDLYGTGMDKRLIPEVPVPEPEKSEYIPTEQEQSRIQQERFYNLMDEYTKLSPALALFRYAILPKAGYADPIDFYRQTGTKSMDNISRMFTPKQEPKRGRQ